MAITRSFVAIINNLAQEQAQINTALTTVYDAIDAVPSTLGPNTWTGTQTVAPAANTDAVFAATGTGTGEAWFAASAPSGVRKGLRIQTGGVDRWRIHGNQTKETGSKNVGTNLYLARCNDAGTVLNTPLNIDRSTGDLTLDGNTYVTNGNVGIGTITPTAVFGTTMEVHGAASATVSVTGSTVQGFFSAVDGSTAADFGTLTNHPVDLYVNSVVIGHITAHGLDMVGAVTTAAKTVATLPTGIAAGARSFVTDSTLALGAALGLAVVGGGANKVPVYYDGTNWIVG